MGMAQLGIIISHIFILVSCSLAQYLPVARWCTTSSPELAKCNDLAVIIHTLKQDSSSPYALLPQLDCVAGIDEFECMNKINAGLADLITLESGQAYVAGRYFSMRPLMIEQYRYGSNLESTYYSVAVVKKNAPGPKINFDTLKSTNSCHTGVGQAASWIYPISTLMSRGVMTVQECNVNVKSAAHFFNSMCAPDALNSYYNPYGDNPVKSCYLCSGRTENWCTSSDPFAGFDGAFRCLNEGEQWGQVAFVRDTTVMQMAKNNPRYDPKDFEIICLDGRNEPVENYMNCNWGQVKGHVVMTSGLHLDFIINKLKELLTRLVADYGPVSGNVTSEFQLFDSVKFNGNNLMFSDETVALEVVEEKNVVDWVGEDFLQRLTILEACPVRSARWCVVGQHEKAKCEDMKLAFAAKSLKPNLDCVVGADTRDCMLKIREADADLVSLDAGDVYTAGRFYNMSAIAFEDYGDNDDFYYAVAVARKRESQLTLFNLKGKNTCHGGVRLAAGWIIPVTVLMQTTQIRPGKCGAAKAMGELFTRGCVPGLLEDLYNKKGTNPINLCENCAAGGIDKCKRDSNELYYGDSGAFRCLVEKGGDIAFVRHTAARDNTDGQNQDEWARNRRSDDYELLCRDGRRAPINDWKSCFLAKVPSRAVMTSGFKTAEEKRILWSVINYGQQFYASDENPDFQMFKSSRDSTDLIFSDSTVRLAAIPEERQQYDKWLDGEFMSKVSYLNYYDCTSGASGVLMGRMFLYVRLFLIGLMTLLLL